VTERSTSPWLAFVAGAVAMLAIALLAFAWLSRGDAGEAAKTAVAATQAIPDLKPPRLPDAPRIPDAPIPQPK